MKIFSASVQQTADSFLHAGYVSAQPPAQALEYPPLTDTADTGFSTTLDSAFGLAEPATADGAMTIFPGLTEALVAAAAGIANPTVPRANISSVRRSMGSP